MISAIFEILATGVLCASGSFCGSMFVLGLKDRDFQAVAWSAVLSMAGLAVGLGLCTAGNLIAKGCGL